MQGQDRSAPCVGKLWRIWGCGLAIGLVLGSGAGGQAGARADDQSTFRDHLAAGEFGPALALAQAQTSPQLRDAWLHELAAAQAAAGDRGASYYTSADIQDDRVRTAALKQAAREPVGGRGGGVQPDFESLIELITQTIHPTTWNTVGGQGAAERFPGGVLIDAAGAMRRMGATPGTADERGRLAALRGAAGIAASNRQVRQASPLRKVSLTRLEKEIQLRRAAGRLIDDEMLLLAGLERIKYVFVYPETGDLVLAGPAGDWKFDPEGRIVNAHSGRPVVRLEDLVVVLRHTLASPEGRFGCSITPTQEALARTQAFLQESAKKPLKPGTRDKWLAELRDQLGAQVITVEGIDPRTRAAQLIVEADYRMKLVGIGLEEGTLKVPSYLDLLQAAGRTAGPMDVLRWWFTMNYDAVVAATDRLAFEFRGQGVKVLSENELLDSQGARVHTGNAEELNRQFAANFTRDFATLAAKYPIYAELQNIFDLALVAALIKSEALPDKLNWHLTCFGSQEEFPVSLGAAPKSVETVINHRVVNKSQILAAVSGGVTVEPASYVRSEAMQSDRDGKLGSQHQGAVPSELARGAWWWD